MRHLALLLLVGTTVSAADWPNYLGPTRDNVWGETGILDKFPDGGPKVLWRAKVAGGYAGPAVVDGRVFVGEFVSNVDLSKEVYERVTQAGEERWQCFDAKTGKPVWSYSYPAKYSISFPNGPRATPTVNDGLVYVLGAEGRLSCLDAKTGKPVWIKDFKQDYGAETPLWGFAGHPLVDGDNLICLVGGEGSCVVAFDKKTGKEVWKSMTAEHIGYGSPTIVTVEGQRQLLVFHATSVNALDPATGKKIWSRPQRITSGSSIMQPLLSGDLLLVAGYSHVGQGYRLSKKDTIPEILWTGTPKTGLYPVNTQPHADGKHAYGICQDGELRCVDLSTGKRVWETLDPIGGKAAQCATAMMVRNGERWFLFNDSGELIIAKITTAGYQEIDRAKVIAPTGKSGGRDVVYCAPAFADKTMYVRNDKELIAVSLAK